VATCPAAASIGDIAACAGSQSSAAVESMIGTAEPRSCALLDAAGKLAGFEGVCIPSCPNGVVDAGETCDDGNGDDFDSCTTSCAAGPTGFQYVTLPSAADPPNTPDGTPANAVASGSTLETQFGSTIFNLNQTIHTRYFATGAGDPDAVLVLIPGFAGGSGSFKYLAENLISRAQTNGNIVLEVWAFDRRTNLLEDDAGAVLADTTQDATLALDWYFGAELGLTLDPDLTRRAVFHDGVDLAFIANWTYRMFARDIDAVIDAAHALPSAPKVFLGGHSLGTTFTARYAASDFDDGPGVTAGYTKVDGLVLLEGGGDSVSAMPPSDGALDLVIAKADGGLYHAVKDHAGRCVDGTPCATVCIGGVDDGQPCDPLGAATCDSPGVCGGYDADCVGVALPPGALTNKCVPPVEVYTGDNLNGPLVLVTPEVHAAGDIVGIQGKLDPHGLNLIATDFGLGRAVDLVPGLGILDVLPPASAEAALGFFLDDDFSPIAAFQASLGFSNNGTNLPFLGFVLPQTADPPDPYRLWRSIDEPMPAVAVPNNGFPSAANSRWGQEKEISRVDLLFSFLRTQQRNFGDSYFASSGLSTTAGLSGGTFGGGLDTTALSVTRGRPDIENLTQASAINVPVIAFGGTNGLTPTPGSFQGFAGSIGVCTAPTCTGAARIAFSDPINTVYGGVDGGFEVHLSEGFAHIDVVSAQDDADNNVITPLLAFLERNTP
jgi:pimeloyl-ACP methyl ester carboxylesterase